MKEATGELSGTVIAVVAIAAVAAIFSVVLLPILRNNIKARTYCSSAVCGTCNDGKAQCSYYKDDMTLSTDTITCDCQTDQNKAS